MGEHSAKAHAGRLGLWWRYRSPCRIVDLPLIKVRLIEFTSSCLEAARFGKGCRSCLDGRADYASRHGVSPGDLKPLTI